MVGVLLIVNRILDYMGGEIDSSNLAPWPTYKSWGWPEKMEEIKVKNKKGLPGIKKMVWKIFQGIK